MDDDLPPRFHFYVDLFWYCFATIFALIILIVFLLCIRKYYEAYKTSKLVGPITRKPIIPFSTKFFWEYEGNEWRRSHLPEPKCFVSPISKNVHCQLYSIIKVREIVRKVLSISKPLDIKCIYSNAILDRYENPIPDEARTVSIATIGFEYGKKPHEFIPIYGKKRHSYYTYQMFGLNRIQMTRYHENNHVYIAGFCIYIENPSMWGVFYPEEVIYKYYNSTRYAGFRTQLDFIRGVGMETQKFYREEQAKIEKERRIKEYGSDAEEEEEEEEEEKDVEMEEGGTMNLNPKVEVVNEEQSEETPILSPGDKETSIPHQNPDSEESSLLNHDVPDVEYSHNFDTSPSMTPESLRVKTIPIASSEESSLSGFDSDKISLDQLSYNKLQKNVTSSGESDEDKDVML